MTKFYTYDDDGFYSGEVEAEDQPKNSFTFPPLQRQGFKPWFDGIGWQQVADYTGLSVKEAQEQALDALRSVTFSYKSNSSYSSAERASFDAQYTEALEVLNGGDPGVFLSALMEVYEVTADEMASKIIAKREAYNKAQAKFNARVQAMRRKIEAAKSVNEVPSVIQVRTLRT